MSWITTKIDAEKIGAWDIAEVALALQLCLSMAQRLNTIKSGISLSVTGANGVVRVGFLWQGEVFAVIDCPEHFPPELQGANSMSVWNSSGMLVRRMGDQRKRPYGILLALCAELAGKKEIDALRAKEAFLANGGAPG